MYPQPRTNVGKRAFVIIGVAMQLSEASQHISFLLHYPFLFCLGTLGSHDCHVFSPFNVGWPPPPGGGGSLKPPPKFKGVRANWIWNLEVPVSNYSPYHYLDLFLVVWNSTLWPHCVNNQLVRLPPVSVYLFTVSPITTTVLNTFGTGLEKSVVRSSRRSTRNFALPRTKWARAQERCL